jgi:hypothetical protein
VVFETKFCSLAKIQCFHVPKKQVFLGRHHEVFWETKETWFLKPNFGQGKQKGMGQQAYLKINA